MEHKLLVLADLPAFDVYELLTSVIVPRPIAFVSTLAANGVPNLAPFSYFILGGNNPPSVVFSPATRSDLTEKDTLANIRATGEYVINVVTGEMAAGMNMTSPEFSADVDEWLVSGFTPSPSRLVRPSRVTESPVNLECRLHTVTTHGQGVGSANYVIGEVLAVHLDVRYETSESRRNFPTLARLGGPDYLDLGSGKVFELARPTVADASS